MISYAGFNEGFRFFHGFGTKAIVPPFPPFPGREIHLNQVHGKAVLDLKTAMPEVSELSKGYDGVVTGLANVVLTIRTADCLPILFYNDMNHQVAACHAGWRGLQLGVLQATLAMLADGGPKHGVRAAIGPGIGPDHFEVGEDVVLAFSQKDARFAQFFLPKSGRKFMGNLYGLAKHILLDQGLQPNHIFLEPHCTFCDSQQFHSYRRDGAGAGRNLSYIGLLATHPQVRN